MSSTVDNVALQGWTAVVRDPKVLLSGKPHINEPSPVLVKDIAFPSDDDLVVKVQEYARDKLPSQTYNHSMRVFYFGESMSPSAWCLSSMHFSPAQYQLTDPSICDSRAAVSRVFPVLVQIDARHHSPPPRHWDDPRAPQIDPAVVRVLRRPAGPRPRRQAAGRPAVTGRGGGRGRDPPPGPRDDGQDHLPGPAHPAGDDL